MAPMTRARRPDCIADAETARYYQQRANAGLIIAKGTPVSEEGQGYIRVPGLWSAEQAAGWRLVNVAVHAKGGRSSPSSGMSVASHTPRCSRW